MIIKYQTRFIAFFVRQFYSGGLFESFTYYSYIFTENDYRKLQRLCVGMSVLHSVSAIENVLESLSIIQARHKNITQMKYSICHHSCIKEVWITILLSFYFQIILWIITSKFHVITLISHYFSTVLALTANLILLYPFLTILFHLHNIFTK